jgi:transcription initiation factor TFIIH subunit 1
LLYINHVLYSELKKDISAGIEDPLVDITSFEDKTLDEGYGTGGDRPMGVQSGNIVHQNMIKRYAEEGGT